MLQNHRAVQGARLLGHAAICEPLSIGSMPLNRCNLQRHHRSQRHLGRDTADALIAETGLASSLVRPFSAYGLTKQPVDGKGRQGATREEDWFPGMLRLPCPSPPHWEGFPRTSRVGSEPFPYPASFPHRRMARPLGCLPTSRKARAARLQCSWLRLDHVHQRRSERSR
jgi:hypothetical protein